MQDLESKLRAWWWARQGLDGSLDGAKPADVLRRAGWARSVGGSISPARRDVSWLVDAKDRDAVAKLTLGEEPSGALTELAARTFAISSATRARSVWIPRRAAVRRLTL